MKKYISKIHYLTQDLQTKSHLEQVMAACEAGANWIQYRCLTKSDDELIEEIHPLAAVCDDWGATLIVTDHYHLLDKADIQGVHMEDMNADFVAIREHIGDEKTLGGSANTFVQIKHGFETGAVDYFGCGPFALTLTKPNNYPPLGVQGYHDIVEQMQKHQIDIPVLAVGGVAVGDVEALLQTGIYGIAVSAAVNLAADPKLAFKEMYKKVY